MTIATKKAATPKKDAPSREEAIQRAKDKLTGNGNDGGGGTASEPRVELKMIPLESLIPAPDNPRGPVTPDTDPELSDLADSIKAIGIRQALSVRPHPFEDGSYELIAGHRRHVAAQMAGIEKAPCLVEPHTDDERFETFFAENFHRKGLTTMQQVKALAHFADEKVPQRAIAERAGISQPQVSKLLSLRALPDIAQEAVDDGRLTQESAVKLAALPAKVRDDLCDGGVPSESDIEEVRRDLELIAEVERTRKDLEAGGITVVDVMPVEWHQGAIIDEDQELVPPATLNGSWGTLGHVDPDEHAASEPCHVVAVGIRHNRVWAIPACTTPDNHPKPEEPEVERRARTVEPTPAEKACKSAEDALLPSYRRALSIDVEASLVLPFAARALFRDEEPWETADSACEILALDERLDSDPLGDLARLSEDGSPGTAMLAFAVASYSADLMSIIGGAVAGTPIEVFETESPGALAGATQLLDFLRLVCPNDGIGELADVVADFAEVEKDDDGPDLVQSEMTVEQDEDVVVEKAGVDEAEIVHSGGTLDLDAMEEEPDPTESGTGADVASSGVAGDVGPQPPDADALADAGLDQPAAGEAATDEVPVITIVKGGKPSAVKWLRDCSVCGRLSGFNTNLNDAKGDQRVQKHFDEKHGGVGRLAEEVA